MSYEVRLPQFSMGMSDGEVLEWLVQPGARVAEGDDLVEIETEKVTEVMPSPVSGVLAEIQAPAGETVDVREVLCVIDTEPA